MPGKKKDALLIALVIFLLVHSSLLAGGAFGIEWGMKHLDLRREGIKYERISDYETSALYKVDPIKTHDLFTDYSVLLDYDAGVYQITAECTFRDRERGAVTRFFFEDVKASLSEKYGEASRSRKPWNQMEFMTAVSDSGYNARWYLDDGSSIVLETLPPVSVKGGYDVTLRLEYYAPNWNRCSTRSYDAMKDRYILESKAGRV